MSNYILVHETRDINLRELVIFMRVFYDENTAPSVIFYLLSEISLFCYKV